MIGDCGVCCHEHPPSPLPPDGAHEISWRTPCQQHPKKHQWVDGGRGEVTAASLNAENKVSAVGDARSTGG